MNCDDATLTPRRRAEARRLADVTREIESRHGRKATVEDLGAELGMSPLEVHEAQARLQASTLVCLDDVHGRSWATTDKW